MREPTEADIRAADRANAYGASDVLGLSIRAAAMRQMDAYERARRVEQPPKSVPRFYQAFPHSVIEKDGEPFWGAYFCDGVFLRDRELCRRAQRNSIENDHAEGLRRNDWRDRQRVRFAVTDAGRAALAEPNGAERRIA